MITLSWPPIPGKVVNKQYIFWRYPYKTKPLPIATICFTFLQLTLISSDPEKSTVQTIYYYTGRTAP